LHPAVRTGVDQALLNAIDSVPLSERAARLKQQFLASKPGLAAERTALGMQSWRETEGEPLDIRWGKMTMKWLEGVPTPIFAGQRLAGSLTKYFRGCYPHPENDGSYLAPLLTVKGESTMGGPVEKGTITEADWGVMMEAAAFWKGKTVTERGTEAGRSLLGDWDDLYQKNGHEKTEGGQGWAEISGHAWERVITEGLRGYADELRGRIAKFSEDMDDDLEKLYFWQAALMSVEAAITFGHRYAQQAQELAAQEHDPARRAELEEIARICASVPEQPARTFREGLQSAMMLHTILGVANQMVPPFTWGRLDRYLYPLFKHDIDAGLLTVADAVDLMNDLFLYAARLEVHTSISFQDFQQKGVYSSLGIAGTDEDGNDVSNELSYLVLHSLGLVKVAGVNVVVGWHKDMAPWLMEKATEAAWLAGGGMPQWQNIDHAIELMQQHGISLKDARNYSSHGCSQISPANAPLVMINQLINVPLCVDMVLHNGVASLTGIKLGLETGEPRTFKTYEQFYAAFQKQAEYLIRRQSWHTRLCERARALHYRQPLVSVFMSGCLENGKDVNAGGASSYKMQYSKDRGLVSVADSLVAIKTLVYDEKKVTMDELIDAVDHNFEGPAAAKIRKLCLAAPKYGNDFGLPEQILRTVGKFTASIIESEKNVFGECYVPIRNGQGWHWQSGKALAALPNGRKAREPLSDGSLSAMQGMDRCGPTALLNSALHSDSYEPMAAILTPKLPEVLMKTPDLRHKLASMTDTYLREGGSYVQYNILDANVLREAKKNPEQHRDLVVRVGGYSAYFVALSPEIQDEIIARTEHTL
jgi:formate C-acetyltransferase